VLDAASCQLMNESKRLVCRVGQNRIYNGVYTVILAGKSPHTQSYTAYIHGSGQPYLYVSPIWILLHG